MTDRPSPSDDRAQRNPRTRGLALLSVLWIVALLAVLAAGILYTGRTDTQLARNLMEAAQAEALADGAVEVALAGLVTPADAGGWRRDGATYGWRVDDGVVRVRITEEAGKIDLNGAPAELLAALMQAAGADATAARNIAAAIVDFRDTDNLPEPGGAEDPDYLRAGAAHGARDAPFAVIEELQQVHGMSAALYRRIAPAITVHTGEPFPLATRVPSLVREAMMIEDPDADDSLLPVETVPPAFNAKVLSNVPSLLSDNADVDSAATSEEEQPVFIRSQAQLDGGARFVREAVALPVAGTPSAPYLILEWRQGADWEPAP